MKRPREDDTIHFISKKKYLEPVSRKRKRTEDDNLDKEHINKKLKAPTYEVVSRRDRLLYL